MTNDSPKTVSERFYHACLMALGGIVALWLALELLAQFWGWLLILACLALILWWAVAAYRYWWGHR